MFNFPKSARLLKSHEFRKVRDEGTKNVGKYLILYLLPIHKKEFEKKTSKLGISVPRQFGTAPERNKFKRFLRESFRLSKNRNDQIISIHAKPRPFAKNASFHQISEEFDHLLNKNLSQ